MGISDSEIFSYSTLKLWDYSKAKVFTIIAYSMGIRIEAADRCRYKE